MHAMALPKYNTTLVHTSNLLTIKLKGVTAVSLASLASKTAATPLDLQYF